MRIIIIRANRSIIEVVFEVAAAAAGAAAAWRENKLELRKKKRGGRCGSRDVILKRDEVIGPFFLLLLFFVRT